MKNERLEHKPLFISSFPSSVHTNKEKNHSQSSLATSPAILQQVLLLVGLVLYVVAS